MNAGRLVRKGAARILDMLYPRGVCCLLCGDPRHADRRTCLCTDCAEKLSLLRVRENACPRCMMRVNEKGVCTYCRSGAMKGLKAGYAAYFYRGSARRLIWLLKFYWQDEAAMALIDSMTEVAPRGEYDALVPVPLHEKRLRRRGKNQAETLCGLLSPRLGLPVLQGLKRIRNTHSQVSLSAALRKQNVKGAFQAIESVEGLRLLLVDDVRTTGATARECARELTRAGAGTVGIMTAALVEKAE